MPHKYRILGRNASPYLVRRRTASGELNIEPRDEIEAVRGADVLVAAGGGYVTDTWLTHATGVLGLLSLAQRLGKPTAMFGQGIGPIGRPSLKMQARAVLPRLTTLGLREGTLSRPLARSYGVRADRTIVTGDDALELIDGTEASTGQFLGINMRVSNYSGVNDAAAAPVGRAVLTLGDQFDAPVMALPVGRHEADLDAIASMLRTAPSRTEVSMVDLHTPQDLASACAQCRVVVTGSYHAAVFALAQGVPAVCLTKSRYYDAKFAGLLGLFPSACTVLSLAAPDLQARLRKAVEEAWYLPDEAKAVARQSALRQREIGRSAYQRFFESL